MALKTLVGQSKRTNLKYQNLVLYFQAFFSFMVASKAAEAGEVT